MQHDRRTENAGRIYKVALAGNPNVGKSTLFNYLTKMRQHTGNWPGKTVGIAEGRFESCGRQYALFDLPGTYSLSPHSMEEEKARDGLLYGEFDSVIVVCDATSLKKSLGLALQIRQVHTRVLICVNLLDEAEKKGIKIDLDRLSSLVGAPVCGISAGRGEGIDEMLARLQALREQTPLSLCFGGEVLSAIEPLENYFAAYRPPLEPRWLAMCVLERDEATLKSLEENLGMDRNDEELLLAQAESLKRLRKLGIDDAALTDLSSVKTGEMSQRICDAVLESGGRELKRERSIDKIVTHRVFGSILMLLLLSFVLWLTLKGANYPSELLSKALFGIVEAARFTLTRLYFPEAAVSLICDGVLKTTAWIIAVMLPPMAIFFPLFTLLEDLGYLPRIAFNLDGIFKSCGACGKQALTMCMGLGCNAAGVIGCRIIDSPRERAIAVMTNSFMPCNGRFPTMIAIIAAFFASSGRMLPAALLLTGTVVLGAAASLLASRLLSLTLLRGETSSFTLELPPYRRPKIGEVIVRSIFDRTLFVLARAVKAASPAGLIIWILGNVDVCGETPLAFLTALLDAPGRFLGLDGAVLLAFLMALPANEIVLPALLMCYLSGGSLVELSSAGSLAEALVSNGWGVKNAACMLILTLFHSPCITTLLTIKKETESLKYTLLSAVLPLSFGALLCAVISHIM